jgi:hypothetical protein
MMKLIPDTRRVHYIRYPCFLLRPAGLNNISKYYSCTMKTQGSHPVSNLKRKHHSKALRRSEKMHPAGFQDLKALFLQSPF